MSTPDERDDELAEVHFLPAARPDGELEPAEAGEEAGRGAGLVGPVLDGEVVEPDQDPGDDQVRAGQPGLQTTVGWSPPVREMRPVLPGWLADPAARRAAVRWGAGMVWHRVRYHLVRVPVYALRVLGRVSVGAVRVVGWLYRWVADAESAPIRQAAAAAGEVGGYLAARRVRNDAVRARLRDLALVGVLATAGVLCLLYLAPRRVLDTVVLAVVAALAVAGRQPERPIITGALVRSRYDRLTEPVLMRALAAAGLGGKAAKPKAGQVAAEVDTTVGTPVLVQPIQRDGHGWLAICDLPFGRTAADAMAKRDAIASGLDVASVQVFVEAHRESQRRVTMWVADEDPFAARPRTSALAKCPQVSVWDAQPLGVEPRGREVKPTLIFNSFLIGAVPRMGKTYAARALVAPAVLDPQCDLTILDLKGGRDWQGFGKCAVTYLSGEDDDDIGYAVAVLEVLREEARARFAAFRKMSDAECPESKLTREMARQGMRPHVIQIDEVQNLLTHPEHGKAALPLLVWLAKTAPAAGFLLVMATQRPSGEVIKTDLRDNLTVRIALRVMDWRSSDTILGASAASIGIESNSLQEWHKGVAVIRGISNGRGGDHSTIRTDLLTNEQCARLGTIGRQRRTDAGTLRGHAAGQTDPVAVTVSVVQDVLAVWPGDQPKVWSETLCGRLAELRPELYHDLDPATLTSHLATHDIPVVQVNRSGTNRRGYELTALRATHTRCTSDSTDEPD